MNYVLLFYQSEYFLVIILFPEELWNPLIIEMHQIFPEYNRIAVKFNIAPNDYRFVKYVVSLYKMPSQKPSAHREVYVVIIALLLYFP